MKQGGQRGAKAKLNYFMKMELVKYILHYFHLRNDMYYLQKDKFFFKSMGVVKFILHCIHLNDDGDDINL